MRLEIMNAQVGQWIGICFHKGFKPADVLEMVPNKDFENLLEITPPCGVGTIAFNAVEDIPTSDAACPCGDPTHWIVKYEK